MTIKILPGPARHPEASYAVAQCHHCGTEETFSLSSSIALTEIAERMAQQAGWTVTEWGDYCPICREYAPKLRGDEDALPL